MYMNWLNLEDHLGKIVGTSGKEKEAVDIRIALDRYPDLKGCIYEGQILLCSEEVNLYAVDALISRKDGNTHIAIPYIEDCGVRLYAIPSVIIIGVDNPNGFGIVPFSGWEEKLESDGYSREISTIIHNFLDSHQPASYF